MPYVTSIERLGIQQGIQQGIQRGTLANAREDVIEILEVRFERVPDAVAKTIGGIDDLSTLKTLHKKAVTVGSIEEFESIISSMNMQ